MDDSSTIAAVLGADPAVSAVVADPISSGVDLGFTVAVDAFSGPLDLLLFLVRKSELDIIDIPVATIADQFVALITQWQRDGDLDLEGAGDFILLAATLLEIKARTIAPPPIDEQDTATDEGDDLLDPRADLIGKLLAYRRFKEAVGILNRLEAERALRVPRQLREEIPEDPDEAAGIDLGELDAGQLSQLWTTLLARLGGTGPRTVMKDDLPIELSIRKLAEQAEQQPEISLHGLFAAEPSLQGRVSMLMATLECARQRIVLATQAEQYGDVTLRFRPPAERLIVAVEFAPEEVGKKRRRRPPLVTFQAPVALPADEAEDSTAEADEKHETDEERFLRELNERCDLDGVLTRVQDVEKGFQQYWDVLHPPAPVPVVEPMAAPGAEPAPAVILAETALPLSEVPTANGPRSAPATDAEEVPVAGQAEKVLVAEPSVTVADPAPVADPTVFELATSIIDPTPIADPTTIALIEEAPALSISAADLLPLPPASRTTLPEETASVVHLPVEMVSAEIEEPPRFLICTAEPITVEITEPAPPVAVTPLAELPVPGPVEVPVASVLVESPSSARREPTLAVDSYLIALPAAEEPQALVTQDATTDPAASAAEAGDSSAHTLAVSETAMATSALEPIDNEAAVSASVPPEPAEEKSAPALSVHDQPMLFSAPPDELEEIVGQPDRPLLRAEPAPVTVEPAQSVAEPAPVTVEPDPVMDEIRTLVPAAVILLVPAPASPVVLVSADPMIRTEASPPVVVPPPRPSSRTLLLVLGLSAGAAFAGWWGLATAIGEPSASSPSLVEPFVATFHPVALPAVSVSTAQVPLATPVVTPSLPRVVVEPEPRLMAAVNGPPEQWLERPVWPLAVPWYACLPVAPLPASIFAFVPPPSALTGLPVAAFMREGAWAWCVAGAWTLPPVTAVPMDAFVPDTTPPASLTAWATVPDLCRVPVLTFSRPTGWALLAGR